MKQKKGGWEKDEAYEKQLLKTGKTQGEFETYAEPLIKNATQEAIEKASNIIDIPLNHIEFLIPYIRDEKKIFLG
jgi:hypothetical protein